MNLCLLWVPPKTAALGILAAHGQTIWDRPANPVKSMAQVLPLSPNEPVQSWGPLTGEQLFEAAKKCSGKQASVDSWSGRDRRIAS